MADGKWISDLSADIPLTEAAHRVLKVRLGVVQERLPLAVGETEDTEPVHQLRVATRRARAALDLFALYLPDKSYRAVRKQLRAIRLAAGAARDWDVFLAGLESSGPGRGANLRPGLDFLAGWAFGQRQLAQVALLDALTKRQAEFDQITDEILAAVRPPRGGFTGRTLADLARPRLASLLRELDEAALGDLTDYTYLHQVRIIGKRLRYALEIFAVCFAPSSRESVYTAVETMQDILGRANDSHVAGERLTALRAQLRAARPADWTRYRPGIEKILHYHQRRLPRERQNFFRWWRRWQASGSEGRLADLLEPMQPAAS
jgi:CHAD domain-containing protein